MRPRTLPIASILFVAGLFAALNGETFVQTTTLNILVGRVEVPLGLLMLGAVAAPSVIYFALLARLEASALPEARRGTNELVSAASWRMAVSSRGSTPCASIWMMSSIG